ncbi:hypothetical protein LS68_008235 [Helicobacter sp. MIT 05-5293]|uniref:hypothetical protein n=1 Tax=Helicobacter sp. MIT 05-5293 TaxID=1548149 RepID=UPI00051CE4CA|nr:hypothetical protein [Helicobacter sp. MIT 05-5293]TLD80196.1 hypothetical protein LS68_008235 [Helicobacter sp. MIT 05-5293]
MPLRKLIYAMIICVMVDSVIFIESKAEERCFMPEQIATKVYAAHISNLWLSERAQDSTIRSIITALYPSAIYVEALSWGEEAEIYTFETPIKNLVVLAQKDDKGSVDDWFPNSEGMWDFRLNGKVILQKPFLPKGSVLAVRTATTGSASIGGVVEFELENGVKIQHTITEDGLGSDYFYDMQGVLHSECEALRR